MKSNAIKILVIEDDPIHLGKIEMFADMLGYQIIGCAENLEEACTHFSSNTPDIILSDIGLNGAHDGIEIVQELLKIKTLPTLFITAYTDPKTFEKARKVNPSAYLIKPFNETELHRTIVLAIDNFTQQLPPPELDGKTSQKYLSDSIFIKHDHRFERIRFNDIKLVKADGNCTEIITRNKKYFLTTTLGTIHKQLNAPNLIRVHRSYVINVNCIHSFDGGRIFIEDIDIPISKGYRELVLKQFNTL